jgi:hypothetical protein
MSAKRIIAALKTAADYETELERLRAEIERLRLVTDAQVEAAARSLCMNDPISTAASWEKLEEYQRGWYRRCAKAALEAARAPADLDLEELPPF